MGRKVLTAGMTVRVIGTSDVGSLVMVREAAQTCVIKLSRDGTLKKNVPLDDVEEARDSDALPAPRSPIRLAAVATDATALPASGSSTSSPFKRAAAAVASAASVSSSSSRAAPRRLAVGDRVRAKYKQGSKWFDGSIARVRSDGTYDVEYDDGDVEKNVDATSIEALAPSAAPSGKKPLAVLSPTKSKAARFAVGDNIQARYKKGTKLFAGKIAKAHSDGTYDVRYDDGDVEKNVDATCIQTDETENDPTPRRKEPLSPPKKSASLSSRSSPQVGDAVKARYKKGAKLYNAVVTRVHADGTCDLKYDDGDTESRVESKYMEYTDSNTSKRKDDDEDEDDSPRVSTKGSTTARKSFRVGDDVRAKYKGGKKWYPGTIKRVHTDGTYDVKYEDGDVETRVEAALIEDAVEASVAAPTKPSTSSPTKTSSSTSFAVGDAVKARYKGGTKVFPGTIQRVRSDGTYDIKYEDGDVETSVAARHIEAVETATPRSLGDDLEVGDRVKARYKKGTKFFSGKIVKAHADGSFDIRYEDGDTEMRVKRDLIERDAPPASPTKASVKRDEPVRVGDPVKARYKKGSKYYAGKITRVRTDGTFDVEYEDGDVELRVEASHIEATKPAEADKTKAKSPTKKRGFDVGDTVRARYKKGAKLFRGTIKRVRTDGTYDITYEDGDVETAVALEYIEADEATSNPRDDERSTVFKVGDVIKAQYKNSSKWYSGRISRVRTDGTYDIEYDDGESEARVESSRIERTTGQASPVKKKPKDPEVGDHVQARYKGGKKLYEAEIVRVRTDGTYDVKYEDGDTESRVPREMIEVPIDSPVSKAKRALRVGDAVIATSKASKKKCRGTITRLRTNGTCQIRFRDGTEDDHVPIEKVEREEEEAEDRGSGKKHDTPSDDEEASLAVGDIVQAYFKKGKKLYEGKILVCHSDETYDIRYDDGDVEKRVARQLIVSEPKTKNSKERTERVQLREGDVVMATHKRSSKRVRGRITRARSDGTFDIAFDDGDTATRVARDLIEAIDARDDDEDQRPGKQQFEVGESIKARYKKGAKWFPGKIAKVRTDGTFDVTYEDGDVERSVTVDCIEASETTPKQTELNVGDAVRARYKNGTKWYNGVVQKIRPDKTVDIRYEDGDVEERVKPEHVKRNKADDNDQTDTNETKRKSEKYQKGDVVEADYKGKGRYRRGKVRRVHSNDTLDIEYDNGDVEKLVPVESVRAPREADDERPSRKGTKQKLPSDSENEGIKPRRRQSRSPSSSSESDRPAKPRARQRQLKKGARVTMRKGVDANSRQIGRVKKIYSDERCDIEYKNGEVAKRIACEALLVCSDAESSDDERTTTAKAVHRYKRDQAVLACWRRPTRMVKASMTDRWDEATILSLSDNSTYSIRYRNGEMEEDVPEASIKPRAEAVVERRADSPGASTREMSDGDVLFLLEQLAMTLYEEGELNKKPRLRHGSGSSSDHSSSSSNSDTSDQSNESSPKAKKKKSKRKRDPIHKALETLFDKKSLQRYQHAFEQYDPEASGRLAKSKIIDIVEGLCAKNAGKTSTDTTVRRHLVDWFSTQETLRTHAKFSFNTLMIAFAVGKHYLSKRTIHQNMANALDARFASHHESKKQLELWQQKLGFRTFETLQRCFHDAAMPQMYPAQVRVRELAPIFDQVTRSAVPNKPLEVYLKQMQLLPHHALLLPEFLCCYYQLYGSAEASRVPAWTEQLELRPVAFVASCLFSNGDPCCQRPGDLVRRLCIGRTPTQVDLILRFREVFESLQGRDDHDHDATIATSQLNAFAAKVVADPSVLEPSILALRKRTAAVSLVEVFATCGFVIDELTSTPTVTHVVEKLRLRTESAEVRRILGLVRNMCLKVLRFPNNPDYWRVRSDSPAFQQKIGRVDGATSLMEAVGFLEYGKSHFELRGARTLDGKRASCLPKATLDALREKCAEVDAELAVMDGVESVVSILQRVATEREHATSTPLSLDECEAILKHLVAYVDTILKNPKDSRCWRIRESNKTFQRQVGYLPCCADLMGSIGYDVVPSSQGSVYVLRGTGLGNVGGAASDKSSAVAVHASLANFAFSSMSQQMEWFLWRRKQEMESLLQDDMAYLVQLLGPSTQHSHSVRTSATSTHASTTTGKMYPYGRNALDTFNQTTTQHAQLAMMQTVFDALDTKKRGYLLADDLHRDRKTTPRWATLEAFDLDHDERVDFADFVGALGPALDHSLAPQRAPDVVPFERMTLSEQVSTLVGRLRLVLGLTEAISVVDTTIGLLVRVIDQPNKTELREIPTTAPIVAQSKRVQPVKALLELAGYRAPPPTTVSASPEATAAVVFVLQPHQRVRFQTTKGSPTDATLVDAPTLARLQLIAAMLGGHARVMLFPTISDIGAMARGMGEMRPFNDWIKLVELVVLCLDNIVKHPEDEDRYRQLKTTTTTFTSVVAKVPNGVPLFLAIGFRETDRGTLVLPEDAAHGIIHARKLEMAVGCHVLKILSKRSQSRDADDAYPRPASPRKPVTSDNASHQTSDPAVDYYKRKALAAELAREEALRRSVQLEKQLELVAKSQHRKSATSAPRTPSSRSRATSAPKTSAGTQGITSPVARSRDPARGLRLSSHQATSGPSIEDEILAQFSPRKQAATEQDQAQHHAARIPSRVVTTRGGRGSYTPSRATATKPSKAIQRRLPSTPSSTIRSPHAAAMLHESSLAMDVDAGSHVIVLRSSTAYLETGALVRIGTEHRDLTEERLIVRVDTSTFPTQTKVVLHSALLYPHFVRDLVFIMPPSTVDSGARLAVAVVEAFIRDDVLQAIIDCVTEPSSEKLSDPPRRHSSVNQRTGTSGVSLVLARTIEMADGCTVACDGIQGEQLVLVNPTTGTTQCARDVVTLRRLRAVWEGLLVEYGGSQADRMPWRHLLTVVRRIPWIALCQPKPVDKEKLKTNASASWKDVVEWLQFPVATVSSGPTHEDEDDETPEQLLVLTLLRQHFRALVADERDTNGVFHTVPADELIRRTSASLVTLSASPSDARDMAAVQAILTELESMVRLQGRRCVTWPEVVHLIRHGQVLEQVELFPHSLTVSPATEKSRRIVAALCASTTGVVYLLRVDGYVDVWQATSSGASVLRSTSLVLFYSSASGNGKASKATTRRSLVEDYVGVMAHGLRDPEWRARQQQRVATAIDAFLRSTGPRRTVMSLAACDACLVVNATMLSEADRLDGGGLIYFYINSTSPCTLRPLRRLRIENSHATLKTSNDASQKGALSVVVSACGVIESFGMTANGDGIVFQNVGKASSVVWIASAASGHVLTYVDEFAWPPNAHVLFSTPRCDTTASVIYVASTKSAYVSGRRRDTDGNETQLRCVLPSQNKAASRTSAHVSAIVATRMYVVAAFDNGTIVMWTIMPSHWTTCDARVPAVVIRHAHASIHQLIVYCDGYGDQFRERPPSLASALVVADDEAAVIRHWDATLPNRCVRLVVYLLATGEVVDVAVADAFSTHLLTLDVTSCVAQHSDLLSTPGLDRVLLQPERVVRAVFFACEYRRDGVFAQKSMRELLSDIRNKSILQQTRRDLEAFTKAYDDSVRLHVRCYYRENDSSDCVVTMPLPLTNQRSDQDAVLIGAVGTVGRPAPQRTIHQLWHCAAFGNRARDSETLSERHVWELEAFRIRRQRARAHTASHRTTIAAQRIAIQRDIQSVLARALEDASDSDRDATERTAEALLVKVEQLCWLAALDSRSENDPVESAVGRLFTENEDAMTAHELTQALEHCGAQSVGFSPWLRRLRATLPTDSKTTVTRDEVVLLVRQWRRDFLSIERLCDLVEALGILSHLTTQHTNHENTDTTTRTIITQQFCSFALSQRHAEPNETARDMDGDDHELLSFIPPRLAVAFLLRVSDVRDRLDRCVDVIADRTRSDTYPTRQLHGHADDASSTATPEQIYAQFLLRKRLRQRVEAVEARQTSLEASGSSLRRLDRFIRASATQHLHRILQTALPSVTPSVSSITLCLPIAARRVGTTMLVDADALVDGPEQLALTIVLYDDIPSTPDGLGRFQAECTFYRRVQQWKTRELFLPVMVSAATLPVMRSEYLPGEALARWLVCESLGGWCSLAECVHCLRTMGFSTSLVHWQSLIAFWCHHVVLGLAVLEQENVVLKSLRLEDLLVSPDGTQLRFGRLQVRDKTTDMKDENTENANATLLGRLVLNLCEALAGDKLTQGATDDDATLKHMQQRLLAYWRQHDDSADAHALPEMIETLQQHRARSPNVSLQRVMTAAMVALTPCSNRMDSAAASTLWCLAFADVDAEAPPEPQATELSWALSVHTDMNTRVLHPLQLLANEEIDLLRSSTILMQTLEAFQSILRRLLELSTRTASWASTVQQTMLRWLHQQHVLQRLAFASIARFENCLRTSQREAASRAIHAMLDVIRSTLDLVEAKVTTQQLRNEPATQQLVFTAVRALCTMCGASSALDTIASPRPSAVITAALWRLSESSLRTWISTTTRSPPEHYPRVWSLLRSLRPSLDQSFPIDVDAMSPRSVEPPKLSLWWRQPDATALLQRRPSILLVGRDDADVATGDLSLLYHLLELRFNASRAATSSAPTFRLAALQLWFSSQLLDRKSAAPVLVAHDATARVWQRLDMTTTFCALLRDPDDRVVFGALSILDVYTRVLRLSSRDPQPPLVSATERHQFSTSSPARQLALSLVADPSIVTELTYIMIRLVRTLRVLGESATTASISSRYGASGMRAADPVALLCVALAFLVNGLYGGNVATRHWITSGLSAMLLTHAKTKSLAFVKIVDANWINQSTGTGVGSGNQRASSSHTRFSSAWSVFSNLPLALSAHKISPFELLVRELAIHTASRNTLVLQHLRSSRASSSLRPLVELFGAAARARAHLLFDTAFGTLGHVWEVVRDVHECDGTLDEQVQAIAYATATITVWLSIRRRTTPLPSTIERICETTWSWLRTSWDYVLARASSVSSASSTEDGTLHSAVVAAGLRMAHAVMVHDSLTVAEVHRLTTVDHGEETAPSSPSTVVACVLSLLHRTAAVHEPTTALSSLFRLGAEWTVALVGIHNDESRAVALLQHNPHVHGVLQLVRMDGPVLVRCCGYVPGQQNASAVGLRYATQLKLRLWTALIQHGDRAVAKAIVDDELLAHWLVGLFDNDISLQTLNETDGDTLEKHDEAVHATNVVNARVEALAQLEVLLHACHVLGPSASLVVHWLVSDVIKIVVTHRLLQHEKQRVLSYSHVVRTHRTRHSLVASLATRMVATAKRFVQLVCCVSVDDTTGDVHSAVRASLTAAGVPLEMVAWHQHSDALVGGGDNDDAQRASEFWATWPEASAEFRSDADLNQHRRPRTAVEERDVLVVARPSPVVASTLSSPRHVLNETTPPAISALTPSAVATRQTKRTIPTLPIPHATSRPSTTSTATPMALDELLVCLDSEVADLESVFQRHAVMTAHEKLLAPSRLAAALRECHVPRTNPPATLPSLPSLPSSPLSFSGFLFEYARQSGLDTLWRQSRGKDVTFVRLLPSGRWLSMPQAHWTTVQGRVAAERASLSTSRVVGVLLSLHRGLFARHEVTALVEKTLSVDTNVGTISLPQLRRVTAAVFDAASKRPAVQKLLLQPTSPRTAGMVPVSPVRVGAATAMPAIPAMPQRTATQSPRARGGGEEEPTARASLVQTLVSIDLDSARALVRHSMRTQRRTRRSKAPKQKGGDGVAATGSDDESLGSDAYSPFSESSEEARGSRGSNVTRKTTAVAKPKKKTKGSQAKADAKARRQGSSSGSEPEEKQARRSEDETDSDKNKNKDRSAALSSSSSSSSSARRRPRSQHRKQRRSQRSGRNRSSSSSSSSASPPPSRVRRNRPTDRAVRPVASTTETTTATATLRQVFAKYDVDGDGAIGFADLRRVVGPAASGAELQRWIAAKDRRGVGAVDFADFAFAFAGEASNSPRV